MVVLIIFLIKQRKNIPKSWIYIFENQKYSCWDSRYICKNTARWAGEKGRDLHGMKNAE